MSLGTRAYNSEFIITEHFSKKHQVTIPDIEIRNAVICWTNFAADRDKNFGKRSFSLVLPEDVAMRLKDEGWNIKEYDDPETENGRKYLTEIVVNFEHDDKDMDPDVSVFIEFDGRRSEVRYGRETVGDLDDMNFERVDINISGSYNHRGLGPYKYKGYLNVFRGIQAKSAIRFGGYYDDWLKGSQE